MDRNELEKNLAEAWNRVKETSTKGGIREPEIVYCVSLLGLAVIELDKTSSALAKANVKLARTYTWLTGVLLLVGVVQIVLMIRGH